MKLLIVIFLLCLILFACRNDHCPQTSEAFIDEISIQDSIRVNDSTEIHVKMRAPELCWEDLFAVLKQRSQFEYELRSFGKPTCCSDYCVCPPERLIMDTILFFRPTIQGTYRFTVLVSDDAVKIDSIVVY
jgi:hypothetical protein